MPDLIEAVRMGFELVLVPSDTDQLVYRLRRDGVVSPWGTIGPSCARAAHVNRNYFIAGQTEPGGVVPLRLNSDRALRRRRA